MKGNLYIILGDDDYLVNLSVEKRINAYLPKQGREFGLEVIYGSVTTGNSAKACVDNVINSVQTPSFFGGSKVTWMRAATFLPGCGRVSEYQESKDAVDKLNDFLHRGLLEGQILIITAAKIRKNSAFFKIVSGAAEIEDFGSGMKSWEQEKIAAQHLDKFIEDQGIKMGSAARKEFLLRAGFDTRTIVSELEKLCVYVVNNNEASVADVREIVSIGREAEAWDVLDAFGKRDSAELVESLQPLSGQSGISIMLSAMIDKNIREMLVLREAFDRRWITSNGNWSSNLPVEADMLLKRLPGNYRAMNGWKLKKNLRCACNYTQQELRVARFRIIELREKLVSSGQPEMFLLQTALLRVMARKKRMPAAGRSRE